jgi:hypothetical protein
MDNLLPSKQYEPTEPKCSNCTPIEKFLHKWAIEGTARQVELWMKQNFDDHLGQRKDSDWDVYWSLWSEWPRGRKEPRKLQRAAGLDFSTMEKIKNKFESLKKETYRKVRTRSRVELRGLPIRRILDRYAGSLVLCAIRYIVYVKRWDEGCKTLRTGWWAGNLGWRDVRWTEQNGPGQKREYFPDLVQNQT